MSAYSQPIQTLGIWDTGFGGINFADRVRRLIPWLDLVVYSDTLVMPLGERSEAQIQNAVDHGVSFLASQGCERIILACNTASCVLPYLRWRWAQPRIQGFIIHGVFGALRSLLVRRLQRAHAVVLCTKASKALGKYEAALRRTAREHGLRLTLDVIACPGLAEVIEKHAPNLGNCPQLRPLCESFLGKMTRRPDVVIAGCSHYEHITPLLFDLLPPNTPIVNPGEIAAEHLWASLQLPGRAQPARPEGKVHFFRSGTF